LKHTALLKPADRAAEGIVWAATTPELAGTSGAFYMRHKRMTLKGAAADPALAAKVWAISTEQTGIEPGARSAATAIPAANRAGS
jgi:hypothetical protein